MEENFNIHMGKKLRMRRMSLGLTQTKVANAINVTFQQIQKYEKGVNSVSILNELKLAEFLKCDRNYFIQPITENGYKFLNKPITYRYRMERENDDS